MNKRTIAHVGGAYKRESRRTRDSKTYSQRNATSESTLVARRACAGEGGPVST